MPKANLKGTVSLDDSAFSAGVRRVKMASVSLSRTVGKGFDEIGRKVAGVSKSLAKFATIAGSVTFAAASAGAAKLATSARSIAANYENVQVKMAAFLKDSNKAEKVLGEIAAFSVVTPFETTGLQEATNILLGAGIAGEEVVDVLKEIAAVSSTTQEVNELADALSKGFAKGKFQTEELNKFLERGINLMPELQRITGLTGDAFQKAIQKGLNFEQVRKAISSMSAEGGLFFGMLKKQSETSTGLISTLSSNWDELLTTIGKPINNALKPLINWAIGKVQEINARLNSMDLTGFTENFIKGLNLENVKALLNATFALSARFFATEIFRALAAAMQLFGNAWERFMGDKVKAIGENLKNSLIQAGASLLNPVNLAASVVDKTMQLKDVTSTAGDNFADTMLSVLDGEDPFNMKEATQELNKVFERWMGGNNRSSDGIPWTSPVAGPSPSPSQGGAKAKGLSFFGIPYKQEQKHSPLLALDLPTPLSNKQLELQKHAMGASLAMSDPRGAFRGLAAGHGMQLERLMGIGPGENNAFARDRRRLGIASGLRTGGLGATRRIGAAAEATAKRRDETIGGTNQRLDKQLTAIEEGNRYLKKGLDQ